MVSKDTYPGSPGWRITHFFKDKDGSWQPSGHREYKDPLAYKGIWSGIEADLHKALDKEFSLSKPKAKSK